MTHDPRDSTTTTTGKGRPKHLHTTDDSKEFTGLSANKHEAGQRFYFR